MDIKDREILQFSVVVSQKMVNGVPVKMVAVPTLTTVPWKPEVKEKIENLADYIAKTVGELLEVQSE